MRDSDFPNLVTHNSEREFYEMMKNPEVAHSHQKSLGGKYFSKGKGISRDITSWLNWDFEVDDTDLIRQRLHNRKMRLLKESQQ